MNQYLLTLVLLLSVTVWGAPYKLQDNNYEAFMAKNDVVLISLFKGTCPECEFISSELEKLETLAGENSFKIAEANCSQEADVCSKFKTERIPGFILVAKNTPVEYNRDLTAEETYSWFLEMIQPSVEEIEEATYQKMIKKQTFMLVSSLSVADKILLSAATRLRILGVPIYSVKQSTTFIRLYLKNRDQPIVYKTPIKPFLFAYEVYHRARPPILSLNKLQNSLYFSTQKDSEKVLIFFDHEDKIGKQLMSVLSQFCMAELVEVPCFTIKKGEQDYDKYAQRFGVNTTESLVVILTDFYKKVFFYKPVKASSQVELVKFSKSAINGTIEASNQKKEQKEVIKYEFVEELSSRNYYPIVQSQPFLFVQYYSTNCPYCIKFSAQYDKVAQMFKDTKEVKVGAINIENQPKIAEKAGIEGYPTFKLYVKGEQINYTGQRNAEAMIDFLMEFSKSRLLLAPKVTDVRKPAIIVTGITEKSTLNSLPALFKRYPIYLVTKEEKEGVQIVDDISTKTYEGKMLLTKVAEWLQEETTPILLSLGENPPSKKLEKAFKNKKPILGLINKGYSGSVDGALQVLEEYCKNAKNHVCGVLIKGEPDYDSFTGWIGDPETQKNRLIWINTQLLKVYIWDGKVEELTDQALGEFVKKVTAGKWKEHPRPSKAQKEKKKQSKPESKQPVNEQL